MGVSPVTFKPNQFKVEPEDTEALFKDFRKRCLCKPLPGFQFISVPECPFHGTHESCTEKYEPLGRFSLQ